MLVTKFDFDYCKANVTTRMSQHGKADMPVDRYFGGVQGHVQIFPISFTGNQPLQGPLEKFAIAKEGFFYIHSASNGFFVECSSGFDFNLQSLAFKSFDNKEHHVRVSCVSRPVAPPPLAEIDNCNPIDWYKAKLEGELHSFKAPIVDQRCRRAYIIHADRNIELTSLTIKCEEES